MNDGQITLRARIRRRERRRRALYITAAVVIIFVAIIGVYVATTLNSQNGLIGTQVRPSDYRALYGIATSSSYGATNTALASSSYVKTPSGGIYYEGSKPIVVYIGAEYCPYCAFTRWPLIIALMRFGNFSGVSYMQSSSTDVYPSTDTFTFVGSTYSSAYLVFEPIEHEARTQGTILQPIPSNYSSVFSSYGSGYPFIDIANKFAIPGTFYYPDYLRGGSGGNWTADIQAIGTSGSVLSTRVMASANALTALICNATGGAPLAVCTNPSVTAYSSSIP